MLKKLFSKIFKDNNISVEIIKHWESTDEDFYAPGALVRVRNGKGTLKEVYGEIPEMNYTFCACMLNEQPLLQLQGAEYYCPTCEKIIRSGYGLSQSFHLDMSEINASKDSVPLVDAIENLFPLLALLSSGFYVILDTKLHPTDGNGNFFWDKPAEIPAKGSCLYYHGDGEWGKLRPYFTIATEPKEKCSKERVEYYLHHNNSRAIAYYMDGYTTALLDGHHKTCAAALQHKDVNALVIMSGFFMYTASQINAGYQLSYRIGNMIFTENELETTKAELKLLEKSTANEKLTNERAKIIWEEFNKELPPCHFPYETQGLADWYPTAEEQAKIELAGNIDDELLDKILRKETIYSERDVCVLIGALGALKHNRLMEMGVFFCNQHYEGNTFYDVLKAMMNLPRTEETEQFFIDKMIEFEDDYPQIQRLILEYL